MLFFVVLSALCVSGFAGINPDEIDTLPGLNYLPNFRQYSGYLNATNDKFLHYWFVESQRDPSHDPLVLWLNGGPGCSSLNGFLKELGPFHVTPDGRTIHNNPFSWNKVANVVFLESPAGVGYSYSESKKYATDDDVTSLDNFNALLHFFDKFPQFRKNEFYIAGESYAGVYIPTLSTRILDSPSDINLKGFMIGNGSLDVKKLSNSVVIFAYNHGLLGASHWNSLLTECCNGCADVRSCDFTSNHGNCTNAVENATVFVLRSNVNIYNIYADCIPLSSSKESKEKIDLQNMLQGFPLLDKLNLKLPCEDESEVDIWLNQAAVRDALHIPNNLPSWKSCSDAVSSGYKRLYPTLKSHILKLLNSGKVRGLIYNGDVDLVCNFMGNEWFVDDLQLEKLDEYQPWIYDGQTAGFVKYYKNLTYLTVKGSGHMVPEDMPGPALKMIINFLDQKPY